MKAVIDTNVVISGLFWKGPPAAILTAWLDKKFEWIVSPSILAEYHQTLRSLESKYPTSATAWGFIRGVSLSATLINAIDLESQVCADADDDKFIAAAITARADTIVSGDKKLLDVDGYQGLRVVKPAVFLKIFP